MIQKEKVVKSQQLTIPEAIVEAERAVKKDNLSIALKLYRAILQQHSNHPIAKKGLHSILKKMQAQHSANVQFSSPPQEQINTLVNLYYSGQMIRAEQACQNLLHAFPESLIVLNIWGAVLRKQGKLNKAVAAFGRAIQLKPDYIEAYNNRGNALRDLGRIKKALNDFNMAIQLKPGYAEAYYNRGNVLKQLCRVQEALNDYNKAIQLKPDYAEVYNNRGNVFRDLGRVKKALNDFNMAIQLKPGYAEVYYNRGNTLKDLGRVQDALNDYNKAIYYKPDYVEAYNNRGISLTHFGRFQEALSDYDRAIQLRPNCVEAHRHMSAIKKYKADDTQIGIMERLLETDKIAESDHMHLSFALAKAYEDIKDYDKSFQFIKRGNDLRKKELNYSLEKDRRIINEVMSIFDKKISITPPKSDPLMPVFIVGMLRSGTTLVEQILASHSQVYGAGELNAMNHLVDKIISRYYRQSTLLDNCQLLQRAVNELHVGYLKALYDLNVSEKIITDKMPGNFMWIGFILSAFPKAKIINLKRDPRATCWSIYKNYFSSKGNGYAYDMFELAEFYNIYIDLMTFWRDCFPNKIYDLCYEDLTEKQGEETRRLLSYCGLEMEAQCLDFHKTERIVRTASATQVRKKMYTGSSNAWKNYEKHIQPIINILSNID